MITSKDIDTLTDRYLAAYRAGDAAACAACGTDDMVYAACGMQPARGSSAIEKLHQELLDSGFKIHGITTTRLECGQDLAFGEQTVTSDAGESFVLIAFRRDTDGEIKVCAEAEIAL